MSYSSARGLDGNKKARKPDLKELQQKYQTIELKLKYFHDFCRASKSIQDMHVYKDMHVCMYEITTKTN